MRVCKKLIKPPSENKNKHFQRALGVLPSLFCRYLFAEKTPKRRISVIVSSARGGTFVTHIPDSEPSRSRPRLGAVISISALHASAGPPAAGPRGADRRGKLLRCRIGSHEGPIGLWDDVGPGPLEDVDLLYHDVAVVGKPQRGSLARMDRNPRSGRGT